MAQRTSKIDELNIVSQETVEEKIRRFFDEMDLPQDEKTERTEMAKKIYAFYYWYFGVIGVSNRLGDKMSYSDIKSRVRDEYRDILESYNYDLTDEYYTTLIEYLSDAEATTTYENMESDYYLSYERAETIAENDTNAFANYRREQEKIKEGYTKKRWVAMLDDKVRKTHIIADGQEVDIRKPFAVGGYKLMFPLDTSLGAHPKECINCRCVAEYIR